MSQGRITGLGFLLAVKYCEGIDDECPKSWPCNGRRNNTRKTGRAEARSNGIHHE
jgi:hypothetical protein